MQRFACSLLGLSRLAGVRLTCLVLLVFALACGTAFAQKDTGSIVGTVRDKSGAVVPDVQVTVTDVDKGTTTVLKTDQSGQYVASPLRIGRYRVTVERSGFTKVVSAPIELSVQQRIAFNVTLQVGSVQQEMEVTGATPLLETETSDIGQVVDSRRVSNLPLNGRNFAQLALLTAGTAPSEPGARDSAGYGFSASGARSLQNNFLLDGVDNNSNLPDLLNESNFVIQPSVEALQEFKVQTNAYSAEFGRGNGAIINATIKSGTNQFHGSAFEFLRNDVFDARNWFDKVGNQVKPPYKHNQFGATFGGPIIKNRTFFFVDYEGLRLRRGEPQNVQVPTEAQRAGDFSDQLDLTSQVFDTLVDEAGNPILVNGQTVTFPVLDCSGRPTYAGEIFNTRLTGNMAGNLNTQLCGMPFGYDASGNPINVIPAGLQDPLAMRLMALFPLPNAELPGGNYFRNPVRKVTRNNFDVRVDHKFTDNNNAFFRFSYQVQPSIIPAPFDTFADGGGFFTGDENNSYRSVALSDTHTFRPTLVNEFRFGYNRANSHRYQFHYNEDLSQQIGFPGVPFTPINGGLPQITFSDLNSTLGTPPFLPSVEIQNTYSLTDNVTWVKGRHTLKFGTEIRREEFTIFQPAFSRGEVDFGNQFTANPGSVNPDAGGSGLASFLLGIPGGGYLTGMENIDYFRPTYSFFTQDDWKITPRLTLNLGLRYELFTTVKERHDRQSYFDFNTLTIIAPKSNTTALTPTLASFLTLQNTGSRGLVPTDTNNFAPRIGFAYKMNEKTVLRGGYGLFYGGAENGPYSNPSPGFNPPFFPTQIWSTPCGAASANAAVNDCSIPGLNVLSQGFPADSLVDPNTPWIFSMDRNLVTPYMQQWHLSVQRELPADTVFELTYAGSKGTKLYAFYNGNQADPSPDPLAPLADRRRYPAIDSAIPWFKSDARSTYHSLQMRAEKRFTHGLSFLASYTWAHALDTASSADLGAQNGGDFRWYKHPEWEYGNADFDIRHRFTLSYIFELPIGHGKRLAGNASGALNQIIGGWQLAGIFSASTGNWFTITDALGFSNSDGGGNVGNGQRPDLVGDPLKAGPVAANPDCAAPSKIRTVENWFNPCAFGDPPLGSFGNVGRNTIQGPGYQIWDFSLFKTFQTSERTRLEFRTEFFNVLNHPNFMFVRPEPQISNDSTVRNTDQFGILTAARDPRQIQFALKFSF